MKYPGQLTLTQILHYIILNHIKLQDQKDLHITLYPTRCNAKFAASGALGGLIRLRPLWADFANAKSGIKIIYNGTSPSILPEFCLNLSLIINDGIIIFQGMNYRKRHLEPKILKFSKISPAILLTGARQTGKAHCFRMCYHITGFSSAPARLPGARFP
jgi:hypothetical protein